MVNLACYFTKLQYTSMVNHKYFFCDAYTTHFREGISVIREL
jgi:hypothetical protein